MKIKEHLDNYKLLGKIGQKFILVAVHNHYKRISAGSQSRKDDGVELQKSNILLAGPTGSGKPNSSISG